MEAAAIGSEPSLEVTERALDLYDRIAIPTHRLGRWTMRRRRGISDPELEAVAFDMLAAFENFIAAPVLELTTTVHAAGKPPTDEGSDLAGLNALLDLLRRCREGTVGASGQTLGRALRIRRPHLASLYESKKSEFLERIVDLEKMLILFGAGTEDDAELGIDFIPEPTDLEPGPSIPFSM
jgi:hypothetical protein